MRLPLPNFLKSKWKKDSQHPATATTGATLIHGVKPPNLLSAMKRFNHLGMALAAITLVSCSNEDIFDAPDATSDMYSLTAVMNNGDTRATATNENGSHKFAWQEGDEIGIYAGASIQKMTLSDGAGTAKGIFSATSQPAETVTSAIYPYNTGHKFENNVWTISLPSNYNYSGAYTGNVNCPMLATVNTSETTPTVETAETVSALQFKHLAGAIRFDILSLPPSANKVVLTLPNKKVTGNFTVSDNKITTSDSQNSDEQSIAICFTPQNGNTGENTEQSSVFFFPVPTGDYSGLKLEVKQDETVLNSYTNNTSFSIKKNDMAMYPVITIGGEKEDFLKACESGGTFTLGKDMTIDSNMKVKNDLTLNLNGHDLTIPRMEVNGGTLTVNGAEGDNPGSIIGTGFNDAKQNPSLIIVNGDNASVVVNGGKIQVDYGTCIYQLKGNVSIKGGELTSKYFALANNGSQTADGGKWEISGGKLTSSEGWALYVAHDASVTISGNTAITGKQCCVGMNAGNVSVTGGTFYSDCADNTTVGSDGTDLILGGVFAATAKYNPITLKVSAGTFNGVNAISTSYNPATTAKEKTIEITGGTWQDPEVLNYAADNADIIVEMLADKEIKKSIKMSKGTASLNFNGKIITNKTVATQDLQGIYGFEISGSAAVTFSDNQDNAGGIKIDGTQDNYDCYRLAMWIMDNAQVTINGGSYWNKQNNNQQLDLIQLGGGKADEKPKLIVNGGKFESGCYSTFGNKNPRYWVLNIHNANKTTASIEVKGGEFVNFNPAKPGTDDNESYLAEGYEVKATGKENVDVSKAYYEAVQDESSDEKTRIIYSVAATTGN